jgi:pectin methylesterase-like acyl-CoA thioesterase
MSAILVVFGASFAAAQDGWVKLGEKDVDFSRDHDSIDVDDKGTIREIRMSVQYAPITFDRIVIRYKNGKRQEVPFANLVQADQFSPAITLSGDGGAIDDLDVWYKTDGMSGKKAKVSFYGRNHGDHGDGSTTLVGPVSLHSPGKDWKRIAEKDVNFSLDRDKIDVDDSKKFREIKMSVQYASVKFDRIVIHYKNGKMQEVPFANLIEVDQFSPAVTLIGDGGVIEDIVVWYSTEGMSGKKAKITYYGRM